MTATQKIDGLVNSWYGYAVFTSALALWDRGIGVFSFIVTLIGFSFSVLVAWFFGNRLKAKSSLWRALLLIGSSLSILFGAWKSVSMGMSLFSSFSLTTLFALGIAAIGTTMSLKTFRVLTDSSVKAYFA